MSDLIHFADDASEAVMAGQPGFFDLSDRYEALSAAGDPLERLGSVVDFEVFRSPLVAALRRSVRGKGGRPPFDPVMMFKILVLQALYSLSDEATEFQIKDRLSFQRFLGLGLDGTVPDATTVWLFRERLVQAKAIDRLFARFDAALKDRGYLAMGGQIIDAAVVPAPKQRNTEAEKAAAARADRKGQHQTIQDPRPCRACVRGATAPDGAGRAHHRHRPRHHQDRHGQPGL
jgi:transposase